MAVKEKETMLYYRVTELTQTFDAECRRGPIPTPELHLWQVKFQLAIAQQLTVISQHLGKIVARSSSAPEVE